MCFGMVTHHRPAIMDAVLATMLALGRAIFVIFFYSNNSNHLSQSREKVWTLSFLCLIISLFHAFFICSKKRRFQLFIISRRQPTPTICLNQGKRSGTLSFLCHHHLLSVLRIIVPKRRCPAVYFASADVSTEQKRILPTSAFF